VAAPTIYVRRMQPNWFIGFPLPVAPWLAALEPVPRGARMFAAGDVHVTFAFLGPVAEERARAAWEVARVLPFRETMFAPGPIRGFGNPRRPSAWSVEPADGAPALASFIEAERGPVLEAGGGPPGRRAARPHGTLARPTRNATPDEQRALRAWAERQRLPDLALPVTRMALFTWDAARKDRLFRIVAERAAGP